MQGSATVADAGAQALSTARLSARARPLLPWLLGVVTLASRLPYLRPGYGGDPDAYRVIAAARALRAGAYTASRFPGYPLHEFATALLLPGGPRLVNGATALMSAWATVVLFRLAEQLGLSALRAALLALAFAFTPVVFVNSTVSLDYLWSLCFVLWAAHELVCARPLSAGLLLGAAIGARLTAGAMLVPLLLLNAGVAQRGRVLTRALRLTLAAMASAAACFAPVLYTYGLAFFSYDDSQAVPWPLVLSRAGPEVWGSFGVYAWCGVAAIALCEARALAAWAALPRELRLRWLLAACAAALILQGSAFLLLPHEAAYLIPCVPFALLLVAAFLPTPAIFVLACLLFVSCFVTLDGDGLAVPGPVQAAHLWRVEQTASANRVIRLVANKPGKALIIAGAYLPMIEVKLGTRQQGPHRYLYLLQNQAELDDYLGQGYAIYYFDRGVARRQRALIGIDLHARGARGIFERERASVAR